MITPDYYYIIVGGGLAGLQLALEIRKDIFFKGKKIAIIDPSLKNDNDKTWCFWEEGSGKWDELIQKEWQQGSFIADSVEKELDFAPYSYKMLRSIDFYEYAKSELTKDPDTYFIQDKISRIDEVTRTALGIKDSYTATHFFDSRPPDSYRDDSGCAKIYQHFKGISIETQEARFDPERFTMMDYRVKYRNSTCFTYVLPVSTKSALIEFTFFTPFLTEGKVYDEQLEKYIREVLKIDNYKIAESETGIIPMTDYPFHKHNSKHITKIGTAGGWVKASSGYSFKSTERKVSKLLANIKSGKRPSQGLFSKRFQRYDAIFLDVLEKRNDLGESLFTKFYTKNSIQNIFKFLDEETTFSEEIKIMQSMFHPQFLQSFFNKL
ncbi:lycopene cyclase family protein [Christiangramia sp. OXR-203]|jgi:lycopene beta-cyclase|uniref:lycopene cyclase family protein n=1 Tax=Christiangramia sp. OXR-203 TaxID=3100176 RepID=UPI002AC98FA6|nr:lycopene cyclase family protein [Christiangramia sp. OXR-203]WPY99369.1 lycopene cyclase family protein [Christiangramia sp. OXR-203]